IRDGHVTGVQTCALPISKFTLEVATILGSAGAILYTGGLALPFVAASLAMAPLSASVIQMLTEFFGKQYVEFHREQTRARQQARSEERRVGKEWSGRRGP